MKQTVMTCIVFYGCSALASWPVQYLDEGINRVSQEDVQNKMGPPYEIHKLSDSSVTWHYHEYQGRGMIGAHGTIEAASPSECGEYVLRFDQTRILREWSKKWEPVCEEHTGMWPSGSETEGNT